MLNKKLMQKYQYYKSNYMLYLVNLNFEFEGLVACQNEPPRSPYIYVTDYILSYI